jgi:photosystem II stability/assembly factor-like uncharacterized protein
MTKTKTKTRRSGTGAARPPRRKQPSRGYGRRAPRRRSTAPMLLAGLAVVGVAAALILALRSDDGSSSPERPFVGGDLHSLAIAPTAAERLYVGGHEGVAVSADDGRTWRQVESLAGADAMGWAFTEDRVLVGGHPGLFISDDGGRTFRQENEGLPATDIHALGAGPGVIYAASPQLGVFASTDGGSSWEVRTGRVGHGFMGTILVDPENPDRLVAPDMEAGAVESVDGGRSWRALGGVGGAMWVSWNLRDTDHIVVSGMGQAALTRDGGRSWEPLSVPAGVSAVEISAADAKTLYAGVLESTEAVIWVSVDAGRTWSRP